MIVESEISRRFLGLMLEPPAATKFRERMCQAMTVSYYKYGPVKVAYQHKVNAISSLKKRLSLYESTGNLDYLVDIANFAMIEFMLPFNPKFNDIQVDDIPILYSSISDITTLLNMYDDTGSKNCLVGIASIAEIEFASPTHQVPHDTPTDGGEGRYWHAGGAANERRNDGNRS